MTSLQGGKVPQNMVINSLVAVSIDPKLGRSVMDCRMTFFHHSMYKKKPR